MDRNTSQRRAIRKVFESAGRPLSPHEVRQAAGTEARGIGMATIYRTLKMLMEERWLVAVDLPGEPARYEQSGKPHHHHFHCRACGRVYEVEGCPGNLRSMTPRGFKLERHEVLLYGVCSVCVPGA